MRVKLQLVLCSDDGQEQTVTDVVTLQKDCQRIEHLGLTLKEAKQLLRTIQHRVLQRQVDTFLDACFTCQDCGTPLKVKGYQSRSFRTLFGTFKLASPRLFHCRYRRRKTTSFRPLSSLLTESVAPELLFMETKWSSLVSYGMTVDALTDFLPLEVTLDVKTVRHDTLKVAERCEVKLGEEHGSFNEGCPRDWGNLPIPDGPITVGIDRGCVRDWEAKKHNFEVIVGKSTLAFKREEDEDHPSSKRFGFVQTLDQKPKRRLYEVLKSQGMQLNQQMTFLSDGSDTVRDLQLFMRALSQITENRKVEARKLLIFQDTVFEFSLEKATLRQSLDCDACHTIEIFQASCRDLPKMPTGRDCGILLRHDIQACETWRQAWSRRV
jgi:hypothetical protein